MNKENEFFSAESALAVTKACSPKLVNDQLESVFSAIKQSALSGYNGCRYYPSTLARVDEILIELGYTIVYVYQSGGRDSYTVINWGDDQKNCQFKMEEHPIRVVNNKKQK